MKFLRKRTRPDNLTTESRETRQTLGRTIYVVFLVVFLILVLNYFLGDYVLFRSDGLIMRDQSTVAAPFIAKVESTYVREGQAVEEGMLLLKLRSPEIIERLADLMVKRAALTAQAADLKIRSEVLTALLPLAKSYDAKAETVIKEYEMPAVQGFVPNSRYAEAMRLQFDTRREYVRLTAESRILAGEIRALDAALAEVDTMIGELQAAYSGGLVRAAVSGTAGATVPYQGDVYRPGDPLLTIYFGEPYVLVYLPRRYLFSVKAGMELKVSDGQHTMAGVIKEVLAVTSLLPKEFQNAFQQSGRSQLAKIKLPSPMPFPMLQKVRVSQPYPTLCGEGCWRMLSAARDYF